jgi:hypothetical protein
MAFQTTPAHEAIFQAIREKARNVVIEAVAGAGKTTTIVEALRLVPTSERCVFLAFNASIAKELGRRVPSHVEARTLNSLGHRAWGRHVESTLGQGRNAVKVDGDKLMSILRAEEDRGTLSTAESKCGMAALKLARLGKSNGIVVDNTPRPGLVADTPDEWVRLADHFDVEPPEDVPGSLEIAISLARRLLKASTEDLLVIDFDDQLYLPFVYNADCFRYDRVFVDETQDLSPLQHDLLARSLRAGGQVVAVGDPCQAIYGFRGADSRSMATMKERFNAITLPLHVSYRCPQAVTALAQTVVPHIQPHADAPAGLVEQKIHDADKADLRPGDLVVSRTSAPVVALAYLLLRRRVPVEVLGRDVGKGLTALVKRLRASTVADLLAKLDRWEKREVEKARARHADAKAAAIEDKADTLRVLCDDSETVADVLDTIEHLFSGERSEHRVTLATVHKAKGLEAERVWILNRHLMPHPMAKQAWQQEQERNLLYVAITRAKSELRFATYDVKDRRPA